METVVAYPNCGACGRRVGWDVKARAIYCCSQVDCDVVEYDHDVIRRRATSIAEPVDPPVHTLASRSLRGQPFYWSRRLR